MLKISNLSANFERGGVYIPHGESEITEKDWQTFLANATDDTIKLILRTGALSATEVAELPENLNSFNNPKEARKILSKTTDSSLLKKWLWDAHRAENLWRQRALIRERMSFLGHAPNWTDLEKQQLDSFASWRYFDAYRRLIDVDIPDRIGDGHKQEAERLKLEKSEKKAEIYKEYQEKLRGLEKCS